MFVLLNGKGKLTEARSSFLIESSGPLRTVKWSFSGEELYCVGTYHPSLPSRGI